MWRSVITWRGNSEENIKHLEKQAKIIEQHKWQTHGIKRGK